jgi:hypothetical protein
MFASCDVFVGEDGENYEADEQDCHSVPLEVSWIRTRPGRRVSEILVVFSRTIASCGIGVPRDSVRDIFYMVLGVQVVIGDKIVKCMHVTLLGL